MRALVVEDDPATRRVLVQLLEAFELELDSAATLVEAQASVDSHTPDLLLLDLLLPDGNGITLLEQIRMRRLPVMVAVISAAPNELLANALVLYPQGLFEKPVDVQRFRGWIERAIQRIRDDGHDD